MDDIKNEIVAPGLSQEELEYKLLYETDLEEVKNVINLFNLNIQKRNILRTGKINELQDKIYNQIEKRVDTHPDEFSNKDLLDYFKTLQDTINKSDTSLKDIDAPKIQINQNQLNINMDSESSLSQESKKRVMEAVRNVIKQAQIESAGFTDLTAGEKSDIIDTGYVEKQDN